MAAFFLRHSLLTAIPLRPGMPIPKTKPACSPCRSSPSPPPPPENKERKEGELRRWTPAKIISGAEKLGRELKEGLSPKQKGDWKDVLLMSFSFAVYVYISQRLVCFYCAWISTVNNHF